jgi:hypothetical protein
MKENPDAIPGVTAQCDADQPPGSSGRVSADGGTINLS